MENKLILHIADSTIYGKLNINLVNNLSEEIDSIKYLYRHDDKKCET